MARESSVRLVPAALAACCATLGVEAPARATVPPAVDAMIREAACSGDKATVNTIVKVAQATNPDVADEIAALGASLLANAQEAAKQQRQVKLATQHFFEGWKGEGQAGFGLTSGNTDELSGALGLSLVREGIKLRHKFSISADYRRTNGATSREKYSASYGLDYLFRDGLYVYGLLGWEKNSFAGYSRRFTQSAGVGYQALKTDKMKLSLDAGPALRQTLDVGGAREADAAVRGSLAYRWHINKGMLFTHDASVVSGNGDTTSISTTALTTALSKALSARLSFNVQNETNPPSGRKHTDTATRATIVYDF